MWQQHEEPHETYRHVFFIVGSQCSNWLCKRKSLVSAAMICTTDHTCTSAYLFDVVSVLCLPTSRLILKHNQQKCFVADWHKPLTKAIIGVTICCHISSIVPCAFGHHTWGIQINQLNVTHRILAHCEHVRSVKPSLQCFVIRIVCIAIWNKTFCKLTRFVLRNKMQMSNTLHQHYDNNGTCTYLGNEASSP